MNILNLREYGDLENRKQDIKALEDMISRQGLNFIVDVVSNSIGETVLKYKLDKTEVKRLRDSLLADFKNAINDRT
jgi:hypothetical protein